MTAVRAFPSLSHQMDTPEVPSSQIYSQQSSQDDILDAIRRLHLNGENYACDLTYGNGVFWQKLPRPALCFDAHPQHDFVAAANSDSLPLPDCSLSNCVFDPPFLTYIRGNGKPGGRMKMAERYGGYWTYDELAAHYISTLRECQRILKPKGILVFKCQDIIHNHKMHCTHANIIGWAAKFGLRLLDLFVLTSRVRMPRACRSGRQRHARMNHCFFLVFKKIPNSPL